LVVYDHAFRPKLIQFGSLGVMIFFVISSYLIVGILKKDIDNGKYNVKIFYFKRFLRILPAYYFYLFVLAILLLYLKIFKWQQFWRAPFFLTNYQPRSNWQFPQWFVGHTWSLCVEEQFYILIALLFFLLNKNFLNKKKLLFILITIICLTPFIRISYLYFHFIPNILSGSIHRSFETVSDSLAIGGIIALAENYLKSSKTVIFFKNKTFFLIVLILIFMILNSSIVSAEYGLKPRYLFNLFGLTIINISIGIIMLVYIHFHNQNKIAVFLNNKIIVTIGLWSYSIYLWQQVWLFNWDFPMYLKFLGIFVSAIISYYCIELKCLKLRDNYLNKKFK
jgi:peptidoglycan/LPS O-acetylase OafA/YrhL